MGAAARMLAGGQCGACYSSAGHPLIASHVASTIRVVYDSVSTAIAAATATFVRVTIAIAAARACACAIATA